MHHPRQARRLTVAAVIGALTLGAAVNLGAAPAFAAACPIGGSFTPASQTVEYGQYWDFTASGTGYFNVAHTYHQLQVISTGTPSAYAPELYYANGGSGPTSTVSAPYEVAPLGTGSYSFAITAVLPTPNDECDSFSGQTDSAQLTVAPARLGIELRVIPDPVNAEAAIITARFTGRFVDEYQSSFFPAAAVSPAGVWTITITDADGEAATERSVERAAGDDVLATSFSWADAEPGEQYSASVRFEPSGASAANFDIADAAPFSYTAPESPRPIPSSAAAIEPPTKLPEATPFSVPLLAVIVSSLLIATLAALVVILAIRLQKRPAAPTEGTVIG